MDKKPSVEEERALEQKPRYYRMIEGAFDVVLKLVGYAFLLWGLAMIVWVAYLVWQFLTQGHI